MMLQMLGTACLLATPLAYGQPSVSPVTVPVELLKKHVYFLASDSLKGRETGTQGQRDAAIYCSRTFRQNRLSPFFMVDSGSASFRSTYPFVSTDVAMFGQRMPGQAGSRSALPTTITRFELTDPPRNHRDSMRVLYGQNVGGLLLGTDLKQQVVIISAHYDHLGRKGGQIFPGADDNGSGTASVLSIAATFDSLAQQGIRPRRSVLFLLFSGEEGGLIGSAYFTTHCPLLTDQIVCDLNVDMVGRVDDAHRKKPAYCYLISGERDGGLRKVVDRANKQSVNLELNFDYDTPTDPNQFYYRSDHYNFAKYGIPILFFMDGLHPDYHRPTDTADRINYEVLQQRATLVFQTAWLMANE
ncbi:M28 family peptidase [Fibrella aquatilis]|uniref:M28 family peptidase n=1 Tax=Fibrella aquatilis TaxID=2817059 RepID=A0A939GD08_9BACT|nr:M28 family peptidase [Fibrella aquatilis]MBO0934322.1 M28 family peptidase [Fibrella aquatilis]